MSDAQYRQFAADGFLVLRAAIPEDLHIDALTECEPVRRRITPPG
jgi:hypothetical protein